MGKKLILGIILVVALVVASFHIAWYAGSRMYQNRAIPDGRTKPTFLITNDFAIDVKNIVRKYA